MNTAADPRIEELSPRQVADLLKDGQILLLDVREPHEFAAARIAGATSCPLSSFDPARWAAQPRRIVFQCGSGKRSCAAAVAWMGAAGAERAAHLSGGIGAWRDAGLAVLCGAPGD